MKKKNIIRISIIAGVVLVILLVIAKKSGWIGGESAIEVFTEKAAKRNIVESVSASGKIKPEVEIKISPFISGEVVKLLVKEGDDVKQGQLLAEIDPELYKSSYEQSMAVLNGQKAGLANAKANLTQVKAQFTNTKLTFERNEKLYKQQTISAADYDAAKAAFDVAKAQVEAAEQNVEAAKYNVSSSEAALKQSKENLSRTSIFAPNSGTISKLSVEVGERVTGASQFSSGTEIMRIANLNNMEVNVDVNENDIVRVKLGDTALIEVDAYLNRKFKGIVTQIANSANIQGVSADQVTNFNVKIRILQLSYSDLMKADKPNISPFRPGMSATVEIQTKSALNILTVPIQSVTTREDSTGKKSLFAKKENDKNNDNEEKTNEGSSKKAFKEAIVEYVFLFKNGTAVMQKVKTGIQDNNYIEIKEGLKENDEIIAGPYTAVTKLLKNKSAVKKVDKLKLFDQKPTKSK
ncbi:MAG: efflux RND transporter periplasmic adaptor subunit [Bacteroidetes bacterium]|nr:efflux RND transporter periplasmic adaptor subunit [Bacteroidota bacterium]